MEDLFNNDIDAFNISATSSIDDTMEMPGGPEDFGRPEAAAVITDTKPLFDTKKLIVVLALLAVLYYVIKTNK